MVCSLYLSVSMLGVLVIANFDYNVQSVYTVMCETAVAVKVRGVE